MMYGEGNLINLLRINKLITLTTILFTFIFSSKIYSQEYKYEIGGTIGTSSYMGDINKTNLFLNPGLSGGALFRYNMTFNWSVKFNLITGSVSGRSIEAKYKFPFEKEAVFTRNYADLGAQIEFNFLPYSDKYTYIGTRPYTPYVFAGTGVTYANGNSKFIGLNIPFGVGVKYKLKNRLNIGLELSLRKLFDDDFDVTDKGTDWSLNSPYGIKSSTLKNRDWYSLTMLFLTWEFNPRVDPCHGM